MRADEALRATVLTGLNGDPALRWIEHRDITTRSKMVVYQRQGWPHGEALQKARREFDGLWRDPDPKTVVASAAALVSEAGGARTIADALSRAVAAP